MRPFDRIPFLGALGILAALVVAGVYFSDDLRYLPIFAGFAAAVLAFAVLFLMDYRTRPLARPSPAGPSTPTGAGTPPPEPAELPDAEDPVIVADRIASGEVLPDVVEPDDGLEPEEGAEPAEPPIGPGSD